MSGRGGWVCKWRWCQGSARVEAGMSVACEHWNAQDTCGYGPSANCGCAVWVACGISACVHRCIYINVCSEILHRQLHVSLSRFRPLILTLSLSSHPPDPVLQWWLHSWCLCSSQQREAEQQAALARLAGRLESMNDVEELTALVRPKAGKGEGKGKEKPRLHSLSLVACLSPTASECR